jgi:hypothetical protein
MVFQPLIGIIKPLVVWAEDRDDRPVALLHIQEHTLLANAEHMNPVEALSDPPRRRAL